MAALWYRANRTLFSGLRNLSALRVCSMTEPVGISSQRSGRLLPANAGGGLGGADRGAARAWTRYGLSRSSFEKLDELNVKPDDNATSVRLVRLADKLPFAAFAACRELVAEVRPRVPGRYAVTVLTSWLREGRYR